jgi:hypothetical protein
LVTCAKASLVSSAAAVNSAALTVSGMVSSSPQRPQGIVYHARQCNRCSNPGEAVNRPKPRAANRRG